MVDQEEALSPSLPVDIVVTMADLAALPFKASGQTALELDGL